jgi:hypothetical protein
VGAAKSDLDVTYVSLTPRYPAYDVTVTAGIPLLVNPATQEPLPPDGTDPIRRWPKNGEPITATARVVNHGAAASSPFQYQWLLDGKKLSAGSHAGLAPRCLAEAETVEWRLEGGAFRQALLRTGTFVDLSVTFPFKKKGQRLELRLEPVGAGTEELSAENNSRTERTDALAFCVILRRSAYNRWCELALSGGSFEDWIQQQFAALRLKLEQSTYASAPGGVRQPLRVDLIRVLDDGESADRFDAMHAANGWDGYVDYGPGQDPVADAGRVDWELVRSLAGQLGLVELQPLRVFPESNHAEEGGEPAGVGFEPPPVLVSEETLFPENSVLALNRLTGTRRGYRGAYLYDLPRTCRLRVFDNNGRLVPNAELTVYQAQDGVIPKEPIARGKTDANGEWPLPNHAAPNIRTANGFALLDNPFGKVDLNGSNGLLLVRVVAREDTEYQWLPITALNQSFWRGQTAQATFDLRTRIAPPQSPAPPQKVSVAREGGSTRVVHLEWQGAPGTSVSAYFLYRARYPGYQWERIGSVPAQRSTYSDIVALPAGTTARFRYAVTAVDLQGNESGLGKVRADVVVRGEDDDG